MTDAIALRNAINLLKSNSGVFSGYYSRLQGEDYGIMLKAFAAVCAAAERTLPKTKLMWSVNSGPEWVHFDNLSDALGAVSIEAQAGRLVQIERRTVSAT